MCPYFLLPRNVAMRSQLAIARIGSTMLLAAATVVFGGCHDGPTAVLSSPADRVARTLMCVQSVADGAVPLVQPLDSQGGCPVGFDVKIWY